jgi:hypothetical protein
MVDRMRSLVELGPQSVVASEAAASAIVAGASVADAASVSVAASGVTVMGASVVDEESVAEAASFVDTAESAVFPASSEPGAGVVEEEHAARHEAIRARPAKLDFIMGPRLSRSRAEALLCPDSSRILWRSSLANPPSV